MQQIMTEELTGAALDWAVAVSRKHKPSVGVYLDKPHVFIDTPEGRVRYQPSVQWSQGGPIFDEIVEEFHREDDGTCWAASRAFCSRGLTSLQAALRAFVLETLGQCVTVPEELVGAFACG